MVWPWRLSGGSDAQPRSPWNARISYYDQFVDSHRQFLDLFEKMLREVSGNPRLSLPYWDWTDAESTAAVFADDFMGGNGDPDQSYAVTTGPFRKGEWEITIQDPRAITRDLTKPKPFLVRNFGAYRDRGIALPTEQEVLSTLGVHGYDHRPFNAQRRSCPCRWSVERGTKSDDGHDGVRHVT